MCAVRAECEALKEKPPELDVSQESDEETEDEAETNTAATTTEPAVKTEPSHAPDDMLVDAPEPAQPLLTEHNDPCNCHTTTAATILTCPVLIVLPCMYVCVMTLQHYRCRSPLIRPFNTAMIHIVLLLHHQLFPLQLPLHAPYLTHSTHYRIISICKCNTLTDAARRCNVVPRCSQVAGFLCACVLCVMQPLTRSTTGTDSQTSSTTATCP